MTDSRWQQISDAINTRFAGIRIANGYQTNLGASVSVWPTTPLESVETEALRIRDYPLSVGDADTIGAHAHRLQVLCELVAVGDDAMRSIRAYAADLVQAISQDATWGGLGEETEPGPSSEPQVDQQNRKIARMTMEFVIVYSTDRWSAYA